MTCAWQVMDRAAPSALRVTSGGRQGGWGGPLVTDAAGPRCRPVTCRRIRRHPDPERGRRGADEIGDSRTGGRGRSRALPRPSPTRSAIPPLERAVARAGARMTERQSQVGEDLVAERQLVVGLVAAPGLPF